MAEQHDIVLQGDVRSPPAASARLPRHRAAAKAATLHNGLGFYRFSYLGSDKAYVGVIAQEVQAILPAAVTRGRDGYLRSITTGLESNSRPTGTGSLVARRSPAIEELNMTAFRSTRMFAFSLLWLQSRV